MPHKKKNLPDPKTSESNQQLSQNSKLSLLPAMQNSRSKLSGKVGA